MGQKPLRDTKQRFASGHQCALLDVREDLLQGVLVLGIGLVEIGTPLVIPRLFHTHVRRSRCWLGCHVTHPSHITRVIHHGISVVCRALLIYRGRLRSRGLLLLLHGCRRGGGIRWLARKVGGCHIRWHNLLSCRLPQVEGAARRVIYRILCARLGYVIHQIRVIRAGKALRLPGVLSIPGCGLVVAHGVLLHPGCRRKACRGWFLVVSAVAS